MSDGLNKVLLIGRLGRDPELKTVGENLRVCRFSVATSEYGGKNKTEYTEWHSVIVWGKQAEPCARYLQKGRLVCVEGRNQTTSWTDKETGKKVYKTEVNAARVIFLSDKDRVTAGSVDSGLYKKLEPESRGAEPTPQEIEHVQRRLRDFQDQLQTRIDAAAADVFGDDDIPF